MKIKDLKHNHSLTDLLKVLIFSILMLGPIIAVAVKCAYVVINKNAKDSYSYNQVEQINEINNPQDFISGVNYLNVYKPTSTQQARIIKFNSISIDWQSLGFANRNYTSYFTLNQYLYAYYDNYTDNEHREILPVWGTTLTSFTINFNSILDNPNGNINLGNNQYYLISYTESKLDNVFYYAIDEMSNNQLFSWTKNTGIYTGVKAMTDNLQITTDVIAVLITYWTLLTVIYVIIDIVLKGFTLLTHMFQKESH